MNRMNDISQNINDKKINKIGTHESAVYIYKQIGYIF